MLARSPGSTLPSASTAARNTPSQFCFRCGGVPSERDKAAQEVTETILDAGIGYRPGVIKDTLRTGDVESPRRPALRTKRVKNRKPSILAQDRTEASRRGAN